MADLAEQSLPMADWGDLGEQLVAFLAVYVLVSVLTFGTKNCYQREGKCGESKLSMRFR